MRIAWALFGVVLLAAFGIFLFKIFQPLTPASMRAVIRAKSEVYQSIRDSHDRTGKWPATLDDPSLESADTARVRAAQGTFKYLSDDGHLVWYSIVVPGWNGRMQYSSKKS